MRTHLLLGGALREINPVLVAHRQSPADRGTTERRLQFSAASLLSAEGLVADAPIESDPVLACAVSIGLAIAQYNFPGRRPVRFHVSQRKPHRCPLLGNARALPAADEANVQQRRVLERRHRLPAGLAISGSRRRQSDRRDDHGQHHPTIQSAAGLHRQSGRTAARNINRAATERSDVTMKIAVWITDSS